MILTEAGIGGLKYAMDVRGYAGGVPRLPLPSPSEANKQRIHKLVTEFEPAAVTA